MPRRPPHFKAFTTIQNHRKMLGVYQDDALLAMWLRVGIMAIERFANRTEDSFLCSGLDLLRLAGLETGVANARRKLARLERATPIRIERLDEAGLALALPRPSSGLPLAPPLLRVARWRLTFPNFAKKHGFREGNVHETGPYADADADADVREEEEEPLPGFRAESQRSKPNRTPNRTPNVEAQTRADRAQPARLAPARSARSAEPAAPVVSAPTSEAQAAFDLLLWAIEESMPGSSIPDPGTARWRRWCQELERLHKLGERGGSEGFSWADILAVIRWLPTHEGSGDFRWGLVIRSAANLRKHFARLFAEAKRGASQARRPAGWRGAAQTVHRQIMGERDGDERRRAGRPRG